MMKKNHILIIFLILNLSSYSQIKSTDVDNYSAQAKERVLNYYSSLNLISGNKLENEEKGMIIYETIGNMFESEQNYVDNDLDITGTTQTDFKIKDYLENVRLFYSNSDVAFSIDSMNLSDVYRAKDFYFFKAEVFRVMTISFNNQEKKDNKHLDFYIKFVPGLLNCQIYSIKKHEDNLDQWKKATISTSSVLVLPPQPIPGTAQEKTTSVTPPDPNAVVNMQNDIKKHSRNQTIWLASTAVSAGIGGYFMYASNQKYNEYLDATGSNASQLRETYELYDKLAPVFFGIAGVCAVEFTIQTIKKGKSKEKLRLSTNGNGLALSYNF